ncbi:secreted RxLR effector protein 161-like [Ipomoea triloba]|uniref:secreted RxLR effector protein 161-like n=1 Tax=Ipomoea triloba TaxID=35885 RepID=UPI00125E9BDA|nr:secreted RxLR effector protein 161-like [Ipomoea triloba]
MNISLRIVINNEGKEVDQTKYRGIIGSLLYLTASRPDISFAVGVCARFQANPKESHLSAAKKILRYLKGTQSVRLWYLKGGSFELVGYSDTDFAGCKIDRKSASGTCQFLGGRLISWFNKKQNSIATSTVEAEYIAAGSCCAQILWMVQQLKDYGVTAREVSIMCDNTSDILYVFLYTSLNEHLMACPLV